MSSNTILPRSFYERDTLCVAKDLLGKVLKFADYHGVINEVEAYVGQDDPACHAARGCTPRTAVMFGAAGFSYVYLIYGMYHCLNIVTEREGFPAAVLIRGIDLHKPTRLSLDGPGKICKKLNITKNNNQIDLTQCHARTSVIVRQTTACHRRFFQIAPKIFFRLTGVFRRLGEVHVPVVLSLLIFPLTQDEALPFVVS